MGDLPPLSEMVDEPADLRSLPDRLKNEAKQRREAGDDTKIEDLLAMSRKNDAAYPTSAAIEKAEWFANIYNAEDCPETHPRDLHYTILGEYELRDGTTYENTDKCWRELKEGAKWAQLLGLVDADRIGDSQNEDPTPTAFTDLDDPAMGGPDPFFLDTARVDRTVDDGVRNARIRTTLAPAEWRVDGIDSLIERHVRSLVDETFESIRYDAAAEQPYYLELWCEKSGVLDEDLAAEYDATIREAGGGEFSLEMCRDAIRIARERGQDLVVGVVTDYDPKGADMPKSISRKLEVLAAMERGLEVFVHHAALTREQAAEYELPTSPAKEATGAGDRNPGVMAYETQKEYFEQYAGNDPIEVNSFRSREPDAYEQSVRDVLDPYYDHDLGDRIDSAVQQSREAAHDALMREFDREHDAIADAAEALDESLAEYQDRLEDAFDSVREEIERLREFERQVRDQEDLSERRDDLEDALQQPDLESVLAHVDVEVPEPEAPGAAEDALLDTRRGYDEQIRAYKEFDVRE